MQGNAEMSTQDVLRVLDNDENKSVLQRSSDQTLHLEHVGFVSYWITCQPKGGSKPCAAVRLAWQGW